MWEWCSDWYGAYPIEPQKNPNGPSSGEYKVLRGGAFLRPADNCRVSGHFGMNPEEMGSIGIRLAMNK